MSTIDSLPYYDKEVEDPALKQLAQKEIENELKNLPPLADDDERLPPNIDVFPTSESLRSLLATYSSSQSSMKAIDPSKWKIPELNLESSEEEWKEAEKRSRVGLEHMGIRNANISLLSTYGPNAHLIQNYALEAEAQELEKAVETYQQQVIEVNRSRRIYQDQTGEHLSRLESRWQDLVGNVVQLEMAGLVLEGRVRDLRRKRDELKLEIEEIEMQE